MNTTLQPIEPVSVKLTHQCEQCQAWGFPATTEQPRASRSCAGPPRAPGQEGSRDRGSGFAIRAAGCDR